MGSRTTMRDVQSSRVESPTRRNEWRTSSFCSIRCGRLAFGW